VSWLDGPYVYGPNPDGSYTIPDPDGSVSVLSDTGRGWQVRHTLHGWRDGTLWASADDAAHAVLDIARQPLPRRWTPNTEAAR